MRKTPGRDAAAFLGLERVTGGDVSPATLGPRQLFKTKHALINVLESDA